MSELGKRIEERRNFLGLSQTQLAKRAGMSQQMISKMERGLSRWTNRFPQLADALEVNQAWLVTGEGPMEPGAQTMSEFDLLAAQMTEEQRAGFVQMMKEILLRPPSSD